MGKEGRGSTKRRNQACGGDAKEGRGSTKRRKGRSTKRTRKDRGTSRRQACGGDGKEGRRSTKRNSTRRSDEEDSRSASRTRNLHWCLKNLGHTLEPGAKKHR